MQFDKNSKPSLVRHFKLSGQIRLALDPIGLTPLDTL